MFTRCPESRHHVMFWKLRDSLAGCLPGGWGMLAEIIPCASHGGTPKHQISSLHYNIQRFQGLLLYGAWKRAFQLSGHIHSMLFPDSNCLPWRNRPISYGCLANLRTMQTEYNSCLCLKGSHLPYSRPETFHSYFLLLLPFLFPRIPQTYGLVPTISLPPNHHKKSARLTSVDNGSRLLLVFARVDRRR